MVQQHWHKHVNLIRAGFPFFSKLNFSNMQQFLEDGANGCSLMRSFHPRLSDKPCCQGHPTSYLHPSVLRRPCPQLCSAMKALLIWHPRSHPSISPTTTLPCTVPSPAAASSPLPTWHIFFSLFPSKYWNLHGLPQNIAAIQRGCRQPPGRGAQRVAQPFLHGAARSVFQGWQPHHEYISRRAQPFILILINAWRDPDFCKYILLYVLSSQGRVFKACSK